MTRRELVEALNELLSLHEKIITSHYGMIDSCVIGRQDKMSRQLYDLFYTIVNGASESEEEEDKSYIDIHSNYDKGLLD